MSATLKSGAKSAAGGKREGAGRKPDWFREKCAELASSPKFFEFAQQVFNREQIEPRMTKDGSIVYLEASVGDMVYLWEKLAHYGFGKPIEFVIPPLAARSMDESKKSAERTFNLLKELEADTAHAIA